MYNVKVIEYPTGMQVRVFDKAIKEENWKCDEWGEIPEKPIKAEKEDKEVDKERSALVSANRSLNMIYKYGRSNMWEWFFTMTFNGDKVNRYDYDEVAIVFKNWIDHTLRRRCPNVKYLFVPELHEDGAYHFHGLVSNCEELRFMDSGKKDKTGKSIYNIASFRAGFTTATRIEDSTRAGMYISKYVTKEIVEKEKYKKRYWASRNLDMAKEYMYLLPKDEIKRIRAELAETCTYYNEVDGVYQKTEYFEIPSSSMMIMME